MSITTEKIVNEALSLPSHARAFVAELLIESLDASSGEPLSQAWQNEVQKRCREMNGGTVELREATEVFAKAHAALA